MSAGDNLSSNVVLDPAYVSSIKPAPGAIPSAGTPIKLDTVEIGTTQRAYTIMSVEVKAPYVGVPPAQATTPAINNVNRERFYNRQLTGGGPGWGPIYQNLTLKKVDLQGNPLDEATFNVYVGQIKKVYLDMINAGEMKFEDLKPEHIEPRKYTDGELMLLTTISSKTMGSNTLEVGKDYQYRGSQLVEKEKISIIIDGEPIPGVRMVIGGYEYDYT
jgi:hypothetical protein